MAAIEPKIKNVVFDVGGVLVDERDHPVRKALRGLFDSTEEFNAIWCNLLLGYMTTEECLAWYGMDKPEQRRKVEELTDLDALAKTYLPPRTDVLSAVFDLQKQGYKVFVLSNATDTLRDLMRDYYQIPQSIAGGMFSCEQHMMKPDFRFYIDFLFEYRLLPEETLFFDDKPRNVAAARLCGMHAAVLKEAGDIYRAFYPYQPYWV